MQKWIVSDETQYSGGFTIRCLLIKERGGGGVG